MGDSLLGGRHHGVIGCNDDDGNIGCLRTTGTHGGKCLVTWSIEEGNLAATVQCHTVSTDVLGNTTRLTGNHIGIADIVEQRGLTMVYVTHHGYDWSTWNQIILIILFLGNGLLNLCAHVLSLEAELLSHHVDGLGVETLVDGNHDTHAHQGRDDLSNGDVHHRSQLAYGNELGELQHLAFLLLLTSLVLQLLLNSLTLLLTILSTLLVLVLAGQASQRLLYLACYSLVVNLNLALVATVVVIAAIIVIIIIVLVAVLIAVSVVTAISAAIISIIAAAIVVLGLGIDVNTFFVDTHTLFAIVVLLSQLLLTFLAALLLRFFLRASALVERRKVNLAQHLRLIRSIFLLTLQCEHTRSLAIARSILLWLLLSLLLLSVNILFTLCSILLALRVIHLRLLCFLLILLFHLLFLVRALMWSLILFWLSLMSFFHWRRTDGSSLVLRCL